MNKTTNKNYTNQQYISMRTAFLTAFPKIFTDIPFATDIFANMNGLAIKKGFSFSPNLFSNEMAIEIEARYKSLNCALNKNISKNILILEIASGLSPRHLEYKEYDYFEFDFETIIDIKKEIYLSLGHKELNNYLYGLDISHTNNLHKFLNQIISSKKYDKIIVLNEGLFWYLSREQIKNIAYEFIESFKNIEWVWLTSDCPPDNIKDAEYKNIISSSANVENWQPFNNYKIFSDFFYNLGLSNDHYKLSSFVGYSDLSSAKLFSVDELETIEKINSYTDVAILKLANKI